ncbi:MAG: hypothetical protein IKO47_07730 [Ruminococcus sp.]|nr:hypothetical protein [Ruminococcus sp.]
MKTDWKKITDEAFSSDEKHIFSDSYCRRRAEIQGGLNMDKKRERTRTRRFNIGIAATAAAFILIPVGTVGALHFAGGGSKAGSPAADVSSTEYYTEAATQLYVGAVDIAPVATQIYSDKYCVMELEYDTCYDNVPVRIFKQRGCCAFEYRESGDMNIITPGIVKYNDFDKMLTSLTSYGDMTSSYSTDGYITNKDGQEWHIYIGHKADVLGAQPGQYPTRNLVVKYGDTGYAQVFSVYDNVTDEDLKAFAESLSIKKLDEPQERILPAENVPEYAVVARSFDAASRAQADYYYFPEGYRLTNTADSFKAGGYYYNTVDLINVEGSEINACLSYYGKEDEFEGFLTDVFNANAVQRGGTCLDPITVGEGSQKKTVYISKRKEGPCDGEDEEGWEVRRNTDWYDRDVVIRFDGTGFAVQFCVFHDLPEKELLKFAEGIELKLTETDDIAAESETEVTSEAETETVPADGVRYQLTFANIPKSYSHADGINAVNETTGGCVTLGEAGKLDELEITIENELGSTLFERTLSNYGYERKVYYTPVDGGGTDAAIVFKEAGLIGKVHINGKVSEDEMWAILSEINIATLK